MKKQHIILISVAAIVILGFVLGLIKTSKGTACTLMGCPCEEDGERPCNGCWSRDPVFVLGIFNVFKECSGKEMITCENGASVSTRYDLSDCEYVIGY